MSYFRTGDPLTDFSRHDREQTMWLESLPVCDICDHPIQDDHYYEINGENICQKCLDDHFRKDADDYVK